MVEEIPTGPRPDPYKGESILNGKIVRGHGGKVKYVGALLQCHLERKKANRCSSLAIPNMSGLPPVVGIRSLRIGRRTRQSWVLSLLE
jgi:hypothetical protein